MVEIGTSNVSGFLLTKPFYTLIAWKQVCLCLCLCLLNSSTYLSLSLRCVCPHWTNRATVTEVQKDSISKVSYSRTKLLSVSLSINFSLSLIHTQTQIHTHLHWITHANYYRLFDFENIKRKHHFCSKLLLGTSNMSLGFSNFSCPKVNRFCRLSYNIAFVYYFKSEKIGDIDCNLHAVLFK